MNERGGRAKGWVMMESGSGMVRGQSVLAPSAYPISTHS